LTGLSILTFAETDKMCRVLYLHNPSLKKIETLDLLYGHYNELTLWISARSEKKICLVTNGLRNEGNYLNNRQTLRDGRGKLIAARKTSTKLEVSVNTFVPKVID